MNCIKLSDIMLKTKRKYFVWVSILLIMGLNYGINILFYTKEKIHYFFPQKQKFWWVFSPKIVKIT